MHLLTQLTKTRLPELRWWFKGGHRADDTAQSQKLSEQ